MDLSAEPGALPNFPKPLGSIMDHRSPSNLSPRARDSSTEWDSIRAEILRAASYTQGFNDIVISRMEGIELVAIRMPMTQSTAEAKGRELAWKAALKVTGRALR